MKDLANRVAVVTGGASGIGRGMAECFAAEGMKLVLADIEQEALVKTVAELESQGAHVVGVRCDVSKAEEVVSLAQETLSTYGAVHVLCNNAGVLSGDGRALWEASLDDWRWVLGVNLMGVVHGIRTFIPLMIEQGDEGHIVNTASMAGLVSGLGIYGVTKHAVVSMSESLFGELKNRGTRIGISVLCPGWIKTRIMEAERNRPEAPREDPGEMAPEAEVLRNIIGGLVSSGLEPIEAGKLVVESIKEERFYILTHPDWKDMIRARVDNITEGRDPIGLVPAGEDWGELLSQK
jgi:NAD(P)-dependent dehydrogenase (short-subunit alcohol dehydrogenase family)